MHTLHSKQVPTHITAAVQLHTYTCAQCIDIHVYTHKLTSTVYYMYFVHVYYSIQRTYSCMPAKGIKFHYTPPGKLVLRQSCKLAAQFLYDNRSVCHFSVFQDVLHHVVPVLVLQNGAGTCGLVSRQAERNLNVSNVHVYLHKVH